MKLKLLSAVALISALALSAPAFADAYAGAVAGSNSGAASSNNMGDTFNLSGSVGAAQCANAVNIAGVGASWSDTTCKRIDLAKYWAVRGNLRLADQIVAGDPIVQKAQRELNKRDARAAQPAPTVVSTSSRSAPKVAVPVTAQAGAGVVKSVKVEGARKCALNSAGEILIGYNLVVADKAATRAACVAALSS